VQNVGVASTGSTRSACSARRNGAVAGGKPLKPSQIVDSFRNAVRLADDKQRGGIVFLRLLGRTHTEPSEFIRAFLAHEYAGVMERYKQALFKALPDVPRAEIVWRFHFMLGATSYAIAGTDALRLVADWEIEALDAVTRRSLVPRLMSFLLGRLRAPLPVEEASAVATEPHKDILVYRRQQHVKFHHPLSNWRLRRGRLIWSSAAARVLNHPIHTYRRVLPRCRVARALKPALSGGKANCSAASRTGRSCTPTRSRS
jgi:hypothetical protein